MAGNMSNKRLADPNEWPRCSAKRLRHNEPDVCRDSDYASDESHPDDDDHRSDVSADMYDISSLLINFNMDCEDDWPVDTADNQFAVNVGDADHDCVHDYQYRAQFPPTEGQIFFNYKLETRLRGDQTCIVFVAHNRSDVNDKVVVKIAIASGVQRLNNEFDSYHTLQSMSQKPKLIDFFWWTVFLNGSSTEWAMIVLEKLGPNLNRLMKTHPNRNSLPLETVFDYAVQMITCVETIHSHGLLHRAVEPNHFVTASHANTKQICVLEFTAAKSYLSVFADGLPAHVEYQRDDRLPTGNPLFHSLGYFEGDRRSRRDDMESLGYCLVHLLKGALPWASVCRPNRSPTTNIWLVYDKMQSMSFEDLCDGLPKAFLQYFSSISELRFEDSPNYDLLRQCFRLENAVI